MNSVGILAFDLFFQLDTMFKSCINIFLLLFMLNPSSHTHVVFISADGLLRMHPEWHHCYRDHAIPSSGLRTHLYSRGQHPSCLLEWLQSPDTCFDLRPRVAQCRVSTRSFPSDRAGHVGGGTRPSYVCPQGGIEASSPKDRDPAQRMMSNFLLPCHFLDNELYPLP